MAVVHGNSAIKSNFLELPKIQENRPHYKKNLSRWAMNEVPSFKLVGYLDTDHWTKLKKKHTDFVINGRSTRDNHDIDDRHIHSHNTLSPKPPSRTQCYYYDQGRKGEDLNKKIFNMYQQELFDDHHNTNNPGRQQRHRNMKQASVYNQRAKNGFQFWMDKDPILNHVSLSSKYTFGAKHTFHGLGNAPRN